MSHPNLPPLPNKFCRPDGRATDFLGNDWENAWGRLSKA
jgi:hypothetical protein